MTEKSNIAAKRSNVLTINGGSSSIKFAVYQTNESFSRLLHGNIDRIGLPDSKLTFTREKESKKDTLKIKASDHRSAANFLIDWLEKQIDFSLIMGIGHRVVQGMHHINPEIITPELLGELHRTTPYDPNHLPAELELIEVFRLRHPKLLQVACFDTSFHQTMPRVAKLLPIPRRFDEKGIQRYGFHGLSYSYLMEELARIAGPEAAQGRVILAHLGSGASMAAVKNGKSIDTSMGFTPASGIMMGTRPGDLDPGVLWFIMQSEHLTSKQFNNLINHESGLFGISETSSDMNDLLALENEDIRAAEAISLFCYQAKKCIGAFAAALGGLETLVFAGGIGENAPVIRSRICEGLGFLEIELDEKQNDANAPVISTKNGKTVVRVIHTDEEEMIAKTVRQMISHSKIKSNVKKIQAVA
jgi:acetate kinase